MAIGTTERPVYFSPRMSCPTLPGDRCRKTAGGGDHVDRRCAWGAKRNRAYLPRLPALTRRALPDFAEPYFSRIRIAGNKAASLRSLTSADNPGTEPKLPESRTRMERLGERGSEQCVSVGDVEHAVAADREAAGMAARARHVDISGRVAVSRSMRITPHGPRRTPKL